MRLLNGRSALIFGLLATLAAVGAAAAPAYACTCSSINFSPASSAGSPIAVSASSTTSYPNTVSLEKGTFGNGNDWVYVSITGITSGWTVTVTSPDTVKTLSATQIIVGPFGSTSSSFPYTITVTAPSTSSTTGQFTINAAPSSSGTSYKAVGNACSPLTVYLKTTGVTHGVPEFPSGMAMLMALAIPALLLVRSRSKISAA